jgi:hypothetical protein
MKRIPSEIFGRLKPASAAAKNDYLRPTFTSTAATMFIGGFSLQLFLSLIGALTSRNLRHFLSRALLNKCVRQGGPPEYARMRISIVLDHINI